MEGKKGLPHLFNDGKPSEMDNKTFYSLINWLDENDGVIDTSNSTINEKLDGSSQFFGCDKTGFFWEKFGSDTRFYSVEEIPEYWAGYRRLFTDMYNALNQWFRSLLTSEYKYGTGVGSVKEIKVQIEVITAAGSHSPNNYEINLVPYRKDAFKPNGCLSIIQALVDGEQDNTLKEKIYNQLRHIHNYTVMAGYSLSDYSIDLVPEVMEALKFFEDYDFQTDSEKIKLTVAEIEDIFYLPTRLYKKTAMYEFIESLKAKMSEKILSELKDSTGALTENGMFEGLAIDLNDGPSFKVNSPDFKAAFLKHHQDAVAKKLGKVTESEEKKEPEQQDTENKDETQEEKKETKTDKKSTSTEDTFERAKEFYKAVSNKSTLSGIYFQETSVGGKSVYNMVLSISDDGLPDYMDEVDIKKFGNKILAENTNFTGEEIDGAAEGNKRCWFKIKYGKGRYNEIVFRQSIGGKGKAFCPSTNTTVDISGANASITTEVEEGLTAIIFNKPNYLKTNVTTEADAHEVEAIVKLTQSEFFFDPSLDKNKKKSYAKIEDRYRDDLIRSVYVGWRSTIMRTVKKLREGLTLYYPNFDPNDYYAIHGDIKEAGSHLSSDLFTALKFDWNRDMAQPADIFLIKKSWKHQIRHVFEHPELYTSSHINSGKFSITDKISARKYNTTEYDGGLTNYFDIQKQKYQSHGKSMNDYIEQNPNDFILDGLKDIDNYPAGSTERYVKITNELLLKGIVIGISLKKLGEEEHIEFSGDVQLLTNAPELGGVSFIYNEPDTLHNNTLSGDVILTIAKSKSNKDPEWASRYLSIGLNNKSSIGVSGDSIKMSMRTFGGDNAALDIGSGGSALAGKGTSALNKIEQKLGTYNEDCSKTPQGLTTRVCNLLGLDQTKLGETQKANIKFLTILCAKTMKYQIKTTSDEDGSIDSWNKLTAYYFKIY